MLKFELGMKPSITNFLASSFAVIDFCFGYEKFSSLKPSKEANSIVTPVGICSPTRTFHGARKSAVNFQSRVEPCFAVTRSNLRTWFDDLPLHNRDCAEVLQVLDRLLTIWSSSGLLVPANSSSLFATSVKWCGSISEKDGTRKGPRQLDGTTSAADH